MATAVEPIPLHETTYERYLSYAMSVITSRALPDVRDGLKPVQRRILYTMFRELSLHPTGRYRKCAAVVGEVMGKYHPHGDASIYDALVRMAQPFALRVPLVDGQGNFGSLDGDPPAAMRYTECRLQPMAEELLGELAKKTVDVRPTYDGQRFEPVVLPAQLPHLLINGVEGIAVGMATRVPPHNPSEVVDACVALIDDPDLSTSALLEYIRGPDFPIGGRLLTRPEDLAEVYQTGQGNLRLQGEYTVEKVGRRPSIVITSIPYGQNKARILERVGAEVVARKLPQVVDVRDESTEDVRIVLELKQDATPEVVMAYLYRHTPLEVSWSVNLTALVPSDDNGDLAVPARCNLRDILVAWLRFRLETVRRRFRFDLEELEARIHLLEGFARIFDALDEAISIIRKSEGRREAGEQLMERFDLTDAQTDAILNLRLYKLARLEIRLILEELEDARERAAEITGILASKAKTWAVIRQELLELERLYGDARRTTLGPPDAELTYDPDAYIVQEDTFVVVTRQGWIKRQSSFSDIQRIRVREGDAIGWLIRASTRSTVTFFSDQGAAYVMRVDDIPQTTGYGEPLQRQFAMADGEHLSGVISHDPRNRLEPPEGFAPDSEEVPPPWGIAVTRRGRIFRFPLSAHVEPSTRNGRRYARVGSGDAVLAVLPMAGGERVCLASHRGRGMVFPSEEVTVLKAAGKGVTGIKLREDDEVLGLVLSADPHEGLEVETNQGRKVNVRERSFGLQARGGRGKVILKRGTLRLLHSEPWVQLGSPSETASDHEGGADEALSTEEA